MNIYHFRCGCARPDFVWRSHGRKGRKRTCPEHSGKTLLYTETNCGRCGAIIVRSGQSLKERNWCTVCRPLVYAYNSWRNHQREFGRPVAYDRETYLKHIYRPRILNKPYATDQSKSPDCETNERIPFWKQIMDLNCPFNLPIVTTPTLDRLTGGEP